MVAPALLRGGIVYGRRCSWSDLACCFDAPRIEDGSLEPEWFIQADNSHSSAAINP